MRIAILTLLIGCTPAAQTITPAHPAHPDAEPGRLAGPPAALRPGVVEEAPPPKHDEHAGHAGHEMPAPPADDKPADSKQRLEPPTSVPADAKPPAKKPAKPPVKKPPAKPAKKPAADPHEGHTTPKPTEPPKADDPHKGHHGH